jgi:biopolymer transport protein ExbB
MFPNQSHMNIKALILSAFLAVGMLFSSTEAGHAQQPAADAKPAVQNKSLWEQIKEGGLIMIPIGLCSVLTLYLIVDGSVRTSSKKVMPPEYVAELRNTFSAGDYVGAYNYCKAHPSPFTNIVRVAVSLIGDGKTAVEEGVLSEMAKEDSKIQTQLSYLSVIGVCAPMIGTVTGMIRAFATLGASGIGDPSSLAAAIGEVLVATASGLFIAIPAFGAFYFLRNRAVKAMHDVEDNVTTLFRKMPYDLAAGVHIGDEKLYAAAPNWVAVEQAEGDASEVLPV